jgi:hypothetical protein
MLLLDWVLKTGHNFDGDSLSYLDRMEHNDEEERRKEIKIKPVFQPVNKRTNK